jgi:putative hemolysin
MKTLSLGLQTERYELLLADDSDDILSAQRLRYQVFNLELGEGLAASHETGLDRDEFDPVCDHLLVRERLKHEVVGTYRLQTGTNAALNLGYYSEREFEFAPYEPARHELVELGRACVAAEHRNHMVLHLLWKGIAAYAEQRGARYLTGCSSLTSQDEAGGLAVYRSLAASHLPEPQWRTDPHPHWRCSALKGSAVALPVPRLMRAYLGLGAKICGQPAIDREFRTIDFLTWLDLKSLPVAVLRKFFS